MQKVEAFGLGKLLSLDDAFRERIPGHDRFDGSERITARLLGL
jgi:hypothetical protein